MGDVFAALALIAVMAAGAGVVALLAQRGQRRRVAAARVAERMASWEPAEENRGGRTVVFLRRASAGGLERDRIVVADVADGDPDWAVRVAEARADASSRAAMLNAQA